MLSRPENQQTNAADKVIIGIKKKLADKFKSADLGKIARQAKEVLNPLAFGRDIASSVKSSVQNDMNKFKDLGNLGAKSVAAFDATAGAPALGVASLMGAGQKLKDRVKNVK